MSQADQLHQQLLPLITAINHHPLYSNIKKLADLRIFMQYHVFAVWDFMCLLKALYRKLVCTQIPWFPPLHAQSANLITSIMVEEEGDILPDNQGYQSHFEIYLMAMEKIGADIKPIHQFLLHLKSFSLQDALGLIHMPIGIKQFVMTTFSFFELSAHEIAAAFVFGREAITQMMFQPLLNQLKYCLPEDEQDKVHLVQYYFSRHITLDSKEHFPKALQMLSHLCGHETRKWKEAELIAGQALHARLQFLNTIKVVIEQNSASHFPA